MCIIYFTTHTTCPHSHLLGAWNCGLNCANDARHTFHLDDGGSECATCVFLRREDGDVDPDVVPVAYYAPVFGGDMAWEENGMRHGGNAYEEGIYGYEDEGEIGNGKKTYKALSDPDSLVSEWRASSPTRQHFAYSPAPTLAHASTPYQQHVSALYQDHSPSTKAVTPHNDYALAPQMTPRTAAHRHLVTAQLQQLAVAPKVPETRFTAPMSQFQLVRNPMGDYSLVPVQWMGGAAPNGTRG